MIPMADIHQPIEDFIFQVLGEVAQNLNVPKLPVKIWKEEFRRAHDAWHKLREKKRRPAFVPPTPEEVSVYSQEIGWPLDGVSWCLGYEQKDWMIGKSKMRNWKSAVQKWKRDKIQTHMVPARAADLLSQKTPPEPAGWFSFMCREYPESIYVRQWTDGERSEAPKWDRLDRRVRETVIELMEKHRS